MRRVRVRFSPRVPVTRVRTLLVAPWITMLSTYTSETATRTPRLPGRTPSSMPIWVSNGPACNATASSTTSAAAPAIARRCGHRNDRSVNGSSSELRWSKAISGSG